MKNFGLNRNIAVTPAQTALLIIDVQNYNMEDGGEYAGMDPAEIERKRKMLAAQTTMQGIVAVLTPEFIAEPAP